MVEEKSDNLNSYALWFTIEIVSFYSYIISTILYIFEHQIWTLCGKRLYNERKSVEYDFIRFFKREIEWYACLFLVMAVNIAISILNLKRDTTEHKAHSHKGFDGLAHGPLGYTMVSLNVIHLFQFIILRHIADYDMNIQSKYFVWAWGINGIAYPLILYDLYLSTHIKNVWHHKEYESRYVWVLLDTLITLCSTIYFIVHKMVDEVNEHNDEDLHHCHVHVTDE